jgi:hypothetical protein
MQLRHTIDSVSGWTDFAVVVGAATAALLGLLFVAVSIRVETIAKSAELRNRSVQTLSLLNWAACRRPARRSRSPQIGSRHRVPRAGGRRRRRGTGARPRAGSRSANTVGRSLDAINPTFVTCSLLVIAAVILILEHENRLYFLVPALIAVLVGGVVNAWLILVRLND